jgi:radical SAM/Cys-rich protein
MNTVETLEVKRFDESLKRSGLYPLTARGITTLQVNVGRLCNQACRHCHVDAGPERVEVMKRDTMELCLHAIMEGGYPTVDITGGAPEMNPNYRWFVERCREMGRHIITRTNLTILLEEGYTDTPVFWAENSVEVVASLPYYLEGTTDRQRGKGVFNSSIRALEMLNEVGYGVEGTSLILNLVYNPAGAFLPPSQNGVDADFRRELKKRYGRSFSNIFTITNMPVGRFLNFLESSGNLASYMERLVSCYNPRAAECVMCRNILSVGWDGTLYDCDFNQMLGLKCGRGVPDNLKDFDKDKLANRKVVTGPHCYGCTVGAGSSCTGEVAVLSDVNC